MKLILREYKERTGSYPISILDGVNVYNGTGSSKSNTGLIPSTNLLL